MQSRAAGLRCFQRAAALGRRAKTRAAGKSRRAPALRDGTCATEASESAGQSSITRLNKPDSSVKLPDLTAYNLSRYIERKMMSSRLLTTANQITLLRLIFVPIFAILVMERSYRGALAILIAAAISDMVDGAVARLLHQESRLGVALDPIADKLLMTTAYLVMAFRDVVPWWLTILIISRDVAIIMTAVVISLVAGYRPFRPTLLGKISTVMQVTTMFVAVSYAVGLPWLTTTVVGVFVYLAATFTVASGVHYAIVIRNRYGQMAPEREATKPSN